MSCDKVCELLKSNSRNACDEAVRLLLKIADNVINDPNNPKVRSLQKNNSTVRNKVLLVKGGSDCLKIMGFQETATNFTMPLSAPVATIENVKTRLRNLWKNDVAGAVPKIKETQILESKPDDFSRGVDLKGVKEFKLPPLVPKFSNPFLKKVATLFHNAQAFADEACQKRAKKLIPLGELEQNAQNHLRDLQLQIKKEGKQEEPRYSMQDMLLLELLAWFKEEFFSWVDNPECEKCGGQTLMSHYTVDPKDLIYTDRVEVYICQTCEHLTNFPRYNDLNILLETRRGRCGEWAQVFTLFCRALKMDARYVMDELDHVWTEVYSVTQQRWVHCDPCENACDTPLMYESGWKKKLTYIIAYSPEEVQDVTWRYSSNHKEVLSRRKNCTEDQLIGALVQLREERQKNFSVARKKYLTKRTTLELVELLTEKQPSENENQGRVSGSKAWRTARGEIESNNLFVWKIGSRHIVNNKVTIQYSPNIDCYEFVRGDGRIKQIEDWSSGTLTFKNISLKIEKDWHMVYLARTEGSDEATISWRFEVEDEKVIDTVFWKFRCNTFETGTVSVQLVSDETTIDFPKSEEEDIFSGEEVLNTPIFSGKKSLTINVKMSGGKGDVAWQHTQLFRQSQDSFEFPFVLSLTFR